MWIQLKLRSMHKYHHTARMIVWSCWLSLGSVMFALIHYAQYASDGRGAYSMRLMLMQCGSYTSPSRLKQAPREWRSKRITNSNK